MRSEMLFIAAWESKTDLHSDRQFSNTEVPCMHIPDGYLSPVFSLSTGIITVPAWAGAVNRVRSVVNNRTVPLLAIFAALSFTVMMFNVPVPGGTTAHAVGGTLIAIVLGPWAAVLCISTALIIQALFFGDGGILAIFTNCLNMGIILPFVGYFCYKLLAGKSPWLSTRRVWTAGYWSLPWHLSCSTRCRY